MATVQQEFYKQRDGIEFAANCLTGEEEKTGCGTSRLPELAHDVYAENRVLREKQLVDGTRVIYCHDMQGRITGMQVATAKGKMLTDVACTCYDRWDSVSVPWWREDAAGQLTSRKWDGVEQRYSYDSAGQLVAVTSSDSRTLSDHF
ncbi:MAG: YD repeat-containing protein [Verrucomicrobiae bacterium]|nr:YD repeat-containing protein [Verrucomicrobiae bacterium]